MENQENPTMILVSKQELNSIGDQLQEIKSLLSTQKELDEMGRWLTKKEAGLRLKISTKTLENYCKKGVLSFSQFNGRIYIKVEDIEAHLSKHYIRNKR